jgi:signal transduction histidine kinase
MTWSNRIQRFRASFRFKLLLIFTTATFLIAAALVTFFTVNQIHSLKSGLSNKAYLLANILANGVRLPLYSENHEALSKRTSELFDTPHVARVSITRANGEVLSEIRSPNIPKDVQVISATVPVTTSASLPTADSALAGVPNGTQSVLGTVTVDIDASDLHSAIIRSLVLACVSALGFCVLVISLSYPILKRVTHSFQTLIQGLDTMMAGDFSLKIQIDSDDEAGRAACAVNRLAEALHEREIENRNLQDELQRTMRLEMSQEKQKMTAKLIQTNRMTSLGQLVSSMAHNINTPNGAVKMAGEYLSRSWKDVVPVLDAVTKDEGDFAVGGLEFSIARDEIQKAADSIIHNADRIDRVINDLRSYSVGSEWEFNSNVSVNKAVEGGLSVIRAHGKHADIPISPLLDQAIPNVNGNVYQLEQVVVNLLQNALLAMSPGEGRVIISTSFDKENNEVLIVVKDEGEGITKDALRSLDEPFLSTRIDRGGSGLGLYISNFLVKEHNGRMSFHSEPFKGTIATVHLPAV